MSDRNVHVDTHPSGHPNKTAVNAENPIFGRPADPIPEVSVEQAAIVQSDKGARETVVSPLINEAVADAGKPSAADLDAVAAEKQAAEASGSGTERNRGNADDWTKTKGEGLTADTSSADTGTEYRHGSGEGSSKITPVESVALPTQAEADKVVAEAAAETAAGQEDVAVDAQFKTGEKVTFTPESGNNTTEVYTIDGGEMHEGRWFWRLAELTGLFLGSSLQSTGAAEA